MSVERRSALPCPTNEGVERLSLAECVQAFTAITKVRFEGRCGSIIEGKEWVEKSEDELYESLLKRIGKAV